MPHYFLDTSAFAKLYHAEEGSQHLDGLVSHQSSVVTVSRLALVEIESVIAAKVRTGALDVDGQALFRRRLRADITQQRIRVGPAVEDRHFQRSRRLLVKYGIHYALRTLDALQLALFLDFQEEIGQTTLITSDLRMLRLANALHCATLDPANPELLLD